MVFMQSDGLLKLSIVFPIHLQSNVRDFLGNFFRNKGTYLHVKRYPHLSLMCELVPVQYRECEMSEMVTPNFLFGFQ